MTKSKETAEKKSFNPNVIHIILFVEFNAYLSPYIYHINDQIFDPKFHLINVQRILDRLEFTDEDLDELSESNQTKKRMIVLVETIKSEILHIQDKFLHHFDSKNQFKRENYSGSSLSKSDNKKTEYRFHTSSNSRTGDSELFILITTIYNSNLSKLLIESDIPVRAIVKLVDDNNLNQQKRFEQFYEEHLIKYNFQSKIRKFERKKLIRKVEDFWRTFEMLRKENPFIFKDIIVCDYAIPWIDLESETSLTHLLEEFKFILVEDVKQMQMDIVQIVKLFTCYVSQMKTQNLRTRKSLKIDRFQTYLNLCRSMKSTINIACILDSMVEQIVSKVPADTSFQEQGHALSTIPSLVQSSPSAEKVKKKIVVPKGMKNKPAEEDETVDVYLALNNLADYLHNLTEEYEKLYGLNYSLRNRGNEKPEVLYCGELCKFMSITFGNEKIESTSRKMFKIYFNAFFNQCFNHAEDILQVQSVRDILCIEYLASHFFAEMLFDIVMGSDFTSVDHVDEHLNVLFRCYHRKYFEQCWDFSIPTLISLHDFHQHVMEKNYADLVESLHSCMNPRPSSQEEDLDEICQEIPSDIFLVKDSIKYEQKIQSNFNKTDAHKTEQDLQGIDASADQFNSGDGDKQFKYFGYKYGVPQFVENQGFRKVYNFDESTKLVIEKDFWTSKNVENITIELSIHSSFSCPTPGFQNVTASHKFYFHKKIDSLKLAVTLSNFHIRLNTGMIIGFKTSSEIFGQAVDDSMKRENVLSEKMESNIWSNSGLYIPFEGSSNLFQKFTKNQFRHFPIVSCPNGLTLEVSNDVSYFPFCILQYFNCRKDTPKKLRKYLFDASVMVFKENNEIDVLSGTGEIITILTHTGNNGFIEHLSNIVISEYKITSPEGNVKLYKLEAGDMMLTNESQLKTTLREDFEENCFFIEREDGTCMKYCEDGTLITVYPDGTRICSSVIVEKELVPSMIFDDTMDGFVLISIRIEIIHEFFFKVLYDFHAGNIILFGCNNFKLSLNSDGFSNFHLDADSLLLLQKDGLTLNRQHGTLFHSNEFRLCSENENEAVLSLQSNLCTIKVDCHGNVFKLTKQAFSEKSNEDGQDCLCALDQNISNCSTDSNDVWMNLDCLRDNNWLNNRWFLISPDGCGLELLSFDQVQSYIKHTKQYSRQSIIRELDFVHPHYFKLIFHPIFNEEIDNLSWKMTDVLNEEPHRYPSTYGPKWSHPFQAKNQTGLLRPYCLFYRQIERVDGNESFLQLGRGALASKIIFRNCQNTSISLNVMEHFEKGNAFLNIVTENDEQFISRLIAHVISQALLRGKIEWIGKHRLKLLTDFATHNIDTYFKNPIINSDMK